MRKSIRGSLTECYWGVCMLLLLLVLSFLHSTCDLIKVSFSSSPTLPYPVELSGYP